MRNLKKSPPWQNISLMFQTKQNPFPNQHWPVFYTKISLLLGKNITHFASTDGFCITISNSSLCFQPGSIFIHNIPHSNKVNATLLFHTSQLPLMVSLFFPNNVRLPVDCLSLQLVLTHSLSAGIF